MFSTKGRHAITSGSSNTCNTLLHVGELTGVSTQTAAEIRTRPLASLQVLFHAAGFSWFHSLHWEMNDVIVIS